MERGVGPGAESALDPHPHDRGDRPPRRPRRHPARATRRPNRLVRTGNSRSSRFFGRIHYGFAMVPPGSGRGKLAEGEPGRVEPREDTALAHAPASPEPREDSALATAPRRRARHPLCVPASGRNASLPPRRERPRSEDSALARAPAKPEPSSPKGSRGGWSHESTPRWPALRRSRSQAPRRGAELPRNPKVSRYPPKPLVGERRGAKADSSSGPKPVVPVSIPAA